MPEPKIILLLPHSTTQHAHKLVDKMPEPKIVLLPYSTTQHAHKLFEKMPEPKIILLLPLLLLIQHSMMLMMMLAYGLSINYG